MSDKKHIDRIFQEKLKDFEVSPNPELWTKIQNELNTEDSQSKKLLPIWLRIASIAAVLALLVTIGSFVFNAGSNDGIPTINTVDSNTVKPSQDGLNKTANSQELNTISTDNPETSTANLDEKDGKLNNSSNNSNVSETETLDVDNLTNSQVVNGNGNLESNSETTSNVASNKEHTTPTKSNNALNSNTETRITSASDIDSNASKANYKTDKPSTANNLTKTAALQNSSNATDGKTDSITNESRTASNSNTPNTTNTINNNVSSNSEANKTKTAQTSSSPELDTDAANRALGKGNTQNAVALNAMKSDNPQNEKEKEESLKVGDSLFSESPSIEEAIAQAEELNEEEKEKLVNRWQVYANVAPVYYNSLGSGSHIDEQFVSNSKSGETNMSYGVNVSYALNKKLAVRSGLNSLNLSYDTDNVILFESPTGSSNSNLVNPLRNIDLTSESQYLNALSGENLGFQQINDLFDAAISQRLSYYEVPVELKYKLINKRLGINLIGGVSTFFLNENEVYSEFEEYSTYIGEANNVNNVSFSTNLGIGMNYKFTEQFRFNLEPTFKYQLNAFNNTSGSFRPYIIGVYTGFSYKF